MTVYTKARVQPIYEDSFWVKFWGVCWSEKRMKKCTIQFFETKFQCKT